ncbi:MAG: hypothetical protein J5911_01980 [Clostridia bacterium]|nr:hypothetical protein [Clostridia bacterium]
MLTRKPKVVFTFVEAGFGHIMPIQAISDAFTKKYGDKCEIVNWNIFSDTKDETVLKYGRELSGWTKHSCNNKMFHFGEMISNAIGSKLTLKILDFKFRKAKKIVMDDIVKTAPDLICSTYYSPSHFALECKKTKLLDTIVATYTPDPWIYSAWDRSSDLFFVTSDHTYQYALKHGFKKEQLRVVPFAYRTNIESVTRDKKEARKALGLDENKFTILLPNGAYGTNKTKKVIDALLRQNFDANVVVLCGKNQQIYDFCRSIVLPEDSKTKFYAIDFTNDVFLYNSASDLYIGKGGSNSLMESYYFGVPTIIISHANYLEVMSSNYLINKKGCGKQIFDTNKLVQFIKDYISDPDLKNSFKSSLESFHDASGAEKIADELYYTLKGKFNI